MKILVPTDFSGSAVNAASFAIKLFSKKSEFILENVFQTPKENMGTLIPVRDILAGDSRTFLEKECRLLKTDYKTANIRIQSEEGNIVDTIKRAIRKNNINLVVVGISNHATLGSITRKFIEQPGYWPMLTVPLIPLSGKSKEIVIVVSEGTHPDDTMGITAYLQNLNVHHNKTHHLQFSENTGIDQLKANIKQLLGKHKIGMIVLNPLKGDRLQTAIMEHQLDSIILSLPALLLE